MKYSISPDRSRLTITADAAERCELRQLTECGDGICSDATMVSFLESITCNSELDWIPEGETGDLTSAPMLGIREWEPMKHEYVVLERWAWLDYQVRSLLEDLRDNGEAVLVGGAL